MKKQILSVLIAGAAVLGMTLSGSASARPANGHGISHSGGYNTHGYRGGRHGYRHGYRHGRHGYRHGRHGYRHGYGHGGHYANNYFLWWGW